MGSKAHCFFSYLLPHPTDLKEYSSRFDHRHPVVETPLATPHACFRRLFGHRLIRENANPEFASTAEVTDEAPLDRRVERLNEAIKMMFTSLPGK